MDTNSDSAAVEAHEHKSWEAAAEIYADTVGFITAEAGQAPLLIEYGEIGKASKVLDVGCGPGMIAQQLADAGAEVTGIDFSANMIEVAKKRYPELTFQQANVEKLPFGDETFDVVACNYTAHHFARPIDAFKEVRRVLKAAGRLVIIHPIQIEQPSWGSFADACGEVLPPEQVPGGPLLHVSRPSEYIEVLQKSGFDSPKCQKVEKPVQLAKLSLLLDSAWKICGLEDQPDDVQTKIREGSTKRAERFKHDDGSYSFPDKVLVSKAVK